MRRAAVMAGLAEVLAAGVQPMATSARVFLRPVVRLWRLASLRSQTRGSIPVSTQFDGPITARGGGDVCLGAHCRLGSNVHFDTGDTGRVRLGDRVRINTGGVIVANVRISIGDDTLIGEYVSIRDANHGIASDRLVRVQPLVAVEISIGCDVWIGRGACILKGITIGDGAVVAANSVVNRNVPAYSIYAGVPARQIGRREGSVTMKRRPSGN